MKGNRIPVALLAILGMALATIAHAGPAEDEAQIRASLARWVTSFNSGDLKAAAEVWAPDLIGWAPEGQDDTYAGEKEFAARASGKPPGASYALEINEVMVSGDLAVVRDTWTETPRADPSKARTFRSFEVWRRQTGGSWKIARWIDGPFREVKKSG
jgi:steroid delta-isomerase